MRSTPAKPPVHGASEIWERPETARTIAKDRERLAQRLRGLRLARGLSQEKAAELVGIHPIHLTRIEGKAINVTLATLSALAVAYGVPLGELFSGVPVLPNPRKRRSKPRSHAEPRKAAQKARK